MSNHDSAVISKHCGFQRSDNEDRDLQTSIYLLEASRSLINFSSQCGSFSTLTSSFTGEFELAGEFELTHLSKNATAIKITKYFRSTFKEFRMESTLMLLQSQPSIVMQSLS